MRILPAIIRVIVLSVVAARLGPVHAVGAEPATSPWRDARQRMVRSEIVAAGIKDQRVVQSIRDTPRHEFMAARYRADAYYDMALPIGEGQTISSPFIVAYMTESLDAQPHDRVLEIGTGSGYQAAVLSLLVSEVYSIEIVESLGARAKRTLQRLGYQNVHVKTGDGFEGWPEHAPFDKIIVTCSPEQVPQPLIDQLKEGGRLIIPVGQRYQQTLYLFTKQDGQLTSRELRPTLFVPMTGTAESVRQDRANLPLSAVVNGDFEQPVENEMLPGWYYQRQWEIVADQNAPQGECYISFRNSTAGRPSRALQGLAIDGRKIQSLELSAWIRYRNVRSGGSRDRVPMIAVSLYDADRRDLGHRWLGPWDGTAAWHHVSKKIRIPVQAREGILRIGLFGATGEISLDDLYMEGEPR